MPLYIYISYIYIYIYIYIYSLLYFPKRSTDEVIILGMKYMEELYKKKYNHIPDELKKNCNGLILLLAM